MKNLKISRKIALFLFALLVINGGIITKLLFSMSTVNDQSTEISVNWLPSVRELGLINSNISNFRIAQLQHVGTSDAALMKDAEGQMEKVITSFTKNSSAYEKLISSDEERSIYQSFRSKWDSYMTAHKTFLELSRANKNSEASAFLLGSMKKDYDDANDALDKDIELNNKGALDASALGDAIFAHEKLLSEMLLGVSVLFSVIICMVLTRNIAKPITALKSYMSVLQKGDYDQDVPMTGRRDEIGEMAGSIKSFRESLITTRELERQQKEETQRKLERQERVDKLVKEFDTNAAVAVSSLAAAATELSQTATDMSGVATRTSKQAVDIAAASNTTSSTVQSVASAAEEMSASVKEISQQVTQSVAIVNEATNQANNADATSKEMLEAARSISTVTELIENIASQINLLALNATIESARAGDAGKGFAVVASEVKNLANQTTKATEDIRQKLENLQNMAKNVADALVKLMSSVARVRDVSGNIASAVEEQTAVTQEIASNMNSAASGVEKINSNIGEIERSTETTSAATNQILAASGMLSKQSEDLQQQVRSFLDSIKAA